jgi:anti-sigma factor RsiW
MTCDELDDLIEPLAAGELDVTAAMEAHLSTCEGCRTAYALAVSIERTLVSQPAPKVPDAFLMSVMSGVRRYRWRSERYLDFAFNLLIGLTVIVVAGGLFALLTVSGLAAVSADMVRVFLGGSSELTARAMPNAGLFTATLLVVVGGMGLWWWAEQGFEL